MINGTTTSPKLNPYDAFKAKENVELILITDASRSMSHLTKQTINGINELIELQAKSDNVVRVTHVTFDTMVKVLYRGVAAKDVKKLDTEQYVIGGMTALNDAIGQTLDTEGKRIALEKWATKVIVSVVTDGGENASKDFTASKVKEMITHATKYGWEILYTGANQDSFSTAKGYGIGGQNVSNYTASAAGTQSLYSGLARTMSSRIAGDTVSAHASNIPGGANVTPQGPSFVNVPLGGSIAVPLTGKGRHLHPLNTDVDPLFVKGVVGAQFGGLTPEALPGGGLTSNPIPNLVKVSNDLTQIIGDVINSVE